jgi:poly-gamma-glutamate synthesis protein (capsule biosynthesis protein)
MTSGRAAGGPDFTWYAQRQTDDIVEGKRTVDFSNLECCLYWPPGGHSVEHEGFYADPSVAGAALISAGIHAVGVANNVDYGEAAITGSIARLDEIRIAHATRPATTPSVSRRSAAYRVSCRPDIPPEIVTWADPAYLQWLEKDIADLRRRADAVIASFHWGLHAEVLHYMTEVAHRAIDAGTGMVVGRGPHFSPLVEVYRGKPISYGLGSFSFHAGHGGRRHGDWLGMMVRAFWDRERIEKPTFQFVRHDDRNRTVLRPFADEGAAFDRIARESAGLGAKLVARGDEAAIDLGT